jgi:hypothetical protein
MLMDDVFLENDAALRQVQNELRRQVERLHQENDQLSLQVRTLDGQVDRFVPNNNTKLMRRLSHYVCWTTTTHRLQEAEIRLDTVTTQQGITVDQWVELVRDNRTTMESVKVGCTEQMDEAGG